jgi:hypothetical protein
MQLPINKTSIEFPGKESRKLNNSRTVTIHQQTNPPNINPAAKTASSSVLMILAIL